MPTTYVRKTDNPNMAWSDERRAKWSAQCKEAHASKTWYKKSKKAVSNAISNGRKEAAKFKNRSEGQKKAWIRRKANGEGLQKSIQCHPPTTLSENLLDKATMPAEESTDSLDTKRVIVKPNLALDLPIEKIEAFFDVIEAQLGVRPSLKDFITNAIDEKLSRFWRSR